MGLSELLCALGLSDRHTGLRCITAAVELAAADPRTLTAVTKNLYPQVARRCDMSWKAAEQNIRTCIDAVWSRDPDKLRQLTGCPIPTKPTPAQFISLLVYSSLSAAPTGE